nr:hypothetical protein [uncultured Fluviicola sp.]
MQNSKAFWIFLLLGSLLFSCNSPKRQKKINDGKLYEKLRQQKGYLNAEQLQRLERDFSLKFLDKYDFSGYDEEDTLASFLRVGKDIWMVTCYLENEAESGYPFFRLSETKEKGFKMIKHGTIPAESGECAYELDQLLVRSGEYIFISQKHSGSAVCEYSPLVFHLDGRKVDKSFEFKAFTWNGANEESQPVKSDFKIESGSSESIVFHVHETVTDTEIDEEVSSRNYDLNFVVRNNMIYFKDTVYK